MYRIKKVKQNKKNYLNLLLLADEQEDMVDRYLVRGTMYILEEAGIVRGECVVTDEGDGILEVKNIAVLPESQKYGYGRKLISYVEKTYSGRNDYHVLRVGTGDSLQTIPFYEKCGFRETSRIRNFFTDNYDHPIFEAGKQLIDMVVLEKSLDMRITLCGDDCFKCPRYLAESDEELQRVAELWYRVGYRNHVISNDEIRCSGCYPGKQCGYGLTKCTNAHGVEKCNQCPEFQCDKIREMLRRSVYSQEQCKEVCSPAEYAKLKAAFFDKENNLRK